MDKFAIVPSMALAETFITYDDGNVYTLKEDESVYVSKKDLFTQSRPLSGDVNFIKQDPFTEVDYQEPVVVDPIDAPLGSHDWCLAFEPWANGLTFDQVSFNWSCDTNGDNKYGCGDTQFDESEEGDVCSP
jgi:hypothetical protein